MKTILIASDLSARSDRALGRAVQLAGQHGAALHVLHVMDDGLPKELVEPTRAGALDRLKGIFAAQPGSDGVAAEFHVHLGDPGPDVADTAGSVGADLIIVGQHRDRPFIDMLRETTLERIVRASIIPVLLVVDHADGPYATVLAAVDTSPASTAALTVARRLAPDAPLHAYHAFYSSAGGHSLQAEAAALGQPLREETERKLDDWMSETGARAGIDRPEIVEAGPRAALDRMREAHLPDLLAIGAHSRTALSRWLVGSFAADLVRNPPCDLLVARQDPAAG